MLYISWDLDIISCALNSNHSIWVSLIWDPQWRINLLVNVIWSRWSSLYMLTYLQFNERVSLHQNMIENYSLSNPFISHPAPYSVLIGVSCYWRGSCRTSSLKAYLQLVLSSRISGCIYRYIPKYDSNVLCTLKHRNSVAFICFKSYLWEFFR